MKSQLETLRETIITENVAANPEFNFRIVFNQKGELIVDFLGKWETKQNPYLHEIPCFTIEHDGEYFFVKRFSYVDRKKYKTLKGAAKYINDQVKDRCNRSRNQKAKDDAEKEFKEKSLRMLQSLHDKLIDSGLQAKLCLITDKYKRNHLCVAAARVGTYFEIEVARDYRLEISPAYSRFYATPENAVDILSVLSKKESA